MGSRLSPDQSRPARDQRLPCISSGPRLPLGKSCRLGGHRDLSRSSGAHRSRGRQGFGVALLDGGFASEAGVQFEAGLTVARNAPLLLGLAGVQMKLDHNCDRARESIDEALRIQPNNSSVHWFLAECFENEGDLASASDTYRRAVEETQFPDARLLFDSGMLMEKMGKHQEAAALYQRAALIDPNDLSIKFKLKSQGREW